MKRAVIVLAQGFEEIEAVAPIDLLRRSPVSVTILGLDSLKVKGSHAITLEADLLLQDYSGDFDALVLPGGMPGTTNLANSPYLIDFVQRADRASKLLAAICAAPSVLGKAGVLKNRKATCYPGFEDKLTGAAVQKEPVVCDKNIITSRAAGTALPFSLEIIHYLCGDECSKTIAASIHY